MARKKDLIDEDIIRMARTNVNETSAGTYTENEITTQLSVERGVIWLIHWIEFYVDNPNIMREVAADASERFQMQVTRESKSAIIEASDSDMIQKCLLEYVRAPAIGTDAGPIAYLVEQPRRIDYRLPLPYASQSIFCGLKASGASTGGQCDFRIGYTVQEVSDKFFFRVAQALVG